MVLFSGLPSWPLMVWQFLQIQISSKEEGPSANIVEILNGWKPVFCCLKRLGHAPLPRSTPDYVFCNSLLEQTGYTKTIFQYRDHVIQIHNYAKQVFPRNKSKIIIEQEYRKYEQNKTWKTWTLKWTKLKMADLIQALVTTLIYVLKYIMQWSCWFTISCLCNLSMLFEYIHVDLINEPVYVLSSSNIHTIRWRAVLIFNTINIDINDAKWGQKNGTE